MACAAPVRPGADAGLAFDVVPTLARPRAGAFRATFGWLAALRLPDDTRLGFARLFDFAIQSRYLLDRDHVNGVPLPGTGVLVHPTVHPPRP